MNYKTLTMVATGTALCAALLGSSAAFAQTYDTTGADTGSGAPAGETGGSADASGTTTPGVPNTGAGDMANMLALGVSGLIALGGVTYLLRRPALH
jgi:LPXTG-motif cell wall-anchored protein